MPLLEGKLAEGRLVDGGEFPKVLLPPLGTDQADLSEAVHAECERIIEELRIHGAVLFRGFAVGSATEFERALEAFQWEPMAHVGATTRIKVSDRVYTANEAPHDQLINFHHEMALMRESPSKIFFYCEVAAPEGGETSIVRSDVVAKAMEERLPNVVTKLAEVGLLLGMKTASNEQEGTGMVLNKTWKWIFKTDNEIEAEKRAREMANCSSIHFFEDGSAELVFGPLNPIREFEGKRVWFSPILGYGRMNGDVKRGYGDGGAFPSEAIQVYESILEENCVDVKWQKGDVLLIDNLIVQHARRPGKPPRRILVSLCK